MNQFLNNPFAAGRQTRRVCFPPVRAFFAAGAVLLCALAGCLIRSGAEHAAPAQSPPPVDVKPFRMGRPDLVLLITGGNNGRMEVCNCSGPMAGGLARRSGLVLSYRHAFVNTLLLDAGDAFWVLGDDARNEYLMRGYRTIGYDVQVLGDQEWGAPFDTLRRSLLGGPTEYLSTTVALVPPAALADPDGRAAQPVLPLAKVVKRTFDIDGRQVKLAVLSDLRRRALLFFPVEKLRAMSFAPDDELPRLARDLKREGYLVVLVCHGDDEALKALAEACPADLYVRGHAFKSDPNMQTISGKPVVKVGNPEYVGALAVRLGEAGVADAEFRLELVDHYWPLDCRLMQNYQAYCHVAMRNALDARRKKGLDYSPSTHCGSCHAAQYEFWKTTRHARAYQTLARVQRTGDPDCLTCHTSGFGTESGFYTLEKTPMLANVNCQDCHRVDLASHTTRAIRPARTNEELCQTCHSALTDPRFRYRDRLSAVKCPPRTPATAPVGK